MTRSRALLVVAGVVALATLAISAGLIYIGHVAADGFFAVVDIISTPPEGNP